MKADFLFKDSPVPIIHSVSELNNFLVQHRDYYFCLYLAYKDEAGWQKSTSPKYMNQALPDLIYLPVNIQKDDFDSLREVYTIVQNNERIVAINQTQPHKSNLVLMELFDKSVAFPTNVDAIVKDQAGRLKPYDLNGPSFVGWFNDEVGSFTNKVVLIIGVGGVGEPIARRIAQDQPNRLILVDPADKSSLAQELSAEYYSSLNSMEPPNSLIVLNAAGKEGVTDQSGVYQLLEQHKGKNFIFVDIRPQLEIDIVEQAKRFGWQSFTGFGMNARNDYTLLQEIASLIDEEPPSFEDFRTMVQKVS